MLELISSISLWELTKHSGIWVRNLLRARKKRKRDSQEALRKVIIASRETRVYIRQFSSSEKRNYQRERELTRCWSELGFALKDLKLDSLAQRCQLKGEYWADPERKDWVYLKKIDSSLEQVEQQAEEILQELKL